MEHKNILTVFVDRMKKIGIDVKLVGNYPWIYVDSINGNRVKSEDYFYGNHGFTVAFLPTRPEQKLEFLDIKRLLELIRKYK